MKNNCFKKTLEILFNINNINDGIKNNKDIQKNNIIGELSEKSVHHILKSVISFDKNNEVKIGKYYVDVMLDDSHIIEIQTRSFNKLREKLDFLLKDHVVTIVYPIDYIKTINWIDKDSSEVVSSSKRTNYCAFNKAFPELYKIKQYLNNDNLKIVLLLMETNENRFLDGCDKTKKRRSTKIDKYPVSVKDMLILYEKNDYKYFIKDLLNEFSVKDYKKISKANLKESGIAINILNHLNVIEFIRKEGRSYIYKKLGE